MVWRALRDPKRDGSCLRNMSSRDRHATFDAVYFQIGTLVMAGYLQPADPLPKDPHLLSWGHLMERK